MYEKLPTESKLRKYIIKHLKKIKKNSIFIPSKRDNKKSETKIKNATLKNNKRKTKKYNTHKNNNKEFKTDTEEINQKKKNESNNNSNKYFFNNQKSKRFFKMNNINEENIININVKDYNKYPFTKALREDKRNIFQIFISFVFEKIDFLNIVYSSENFKEIIIKEYLLSLLIDFLLNALLYSDEIVSHKYHNNGKLDFIVTLSISIVSNIITSIIIYFLECSDKFEKLLDDILLIRKENKYLYAFKKFLKYIKLRMIIFIIIEIIIMFCSFYYITIFCIVYSKSQLSLLINYLTSLLEKVIKSIIVIIAIIVTRKIGISCKNMYFFNISKYIDEYF